jgi:general secretion pathway protein D
MPVNRLSAVFRARLGSGLALAAAVLLGGCASYAVIQQAEERYQAGQAEDGLVQLQQALKERPTDPRLRAAQIGLRERVVADWLAQADAAAVQGRLPDAQALYRRVQNLEPANHRARAGLESLERLPRHATLLKEAKEAAEAQDRDGARARLRTLLSQAPDHAEARRLMESLEESAAKPATDAKLATALQKTLSIDFKDAMLRQVFEVFARTSGVNFVFDKDVKSDQKTTVFLKDTSVKDAIEVVLLTNQLEQRVLDRNTLLIYPNTPAKLKDYQPLTVRSFFLANADAEQVAATLKTIVKTRDIVVDKKQNMLIMRDTPEAVRVAEKLVSLHDLPEPEVMLEVEVLEVNRSRLNELGVKFPEQLSLAPLPSTAGGALTLRDLRNLNSGSVGATLQPLNVNARGIDADVNLLANPRIRARNRETAKILIGDKVPNITSTSTSSGFVAENVQYLDVGLKLDVTPVISIDGEVSIKIALEVSNIAGQIKSGNGTLAFQIGTRTASTVLRLKDGENQVLAGLINDEDRRTANKLPGLGDIPLAGRLFSSQLDETKKSEIVLSITPRLIRNTPRPSLAALEFDSGTENSLRHTGNGEAAAARSAAGNSPAIGPQKAASAVPAATGANPPVPAVTAPPASGALAPPAAPAGLRWSGPAQVKAGETFTVQLLLNAAQPIVGIPYAIGFDPAQLDVVGVSEGGFLRQGGAGTAFGHRVDRGTGQIFITNARSGESGGSTGAVGDGALVTLSLKALGPTQATTLQLLSVSPVGPVGAAASLPLPAPHAIAITP